MRTNPGRRLPGVACVRIVKPELDNPAHGNSKSSWGAPCRTIRWRPRSDSEIWASRPDYAALTRRIDTVRPRLREHSRLKCALGRNLTGIGETPAKRTI